MNAVHPAIREGGAGTGTPVSLSVSGLGKAYGEGAVPVFSDISFTVPRGQSVAIIGANGTGKSTLLRCCLRLTEPDRGSVHIDGRDLTAASRPSLRGMRSQVGFIFQKHNLVPRLSVLSNVLHGGIARRKGPRCWFHAIAPRAEREFALHCLDRVGLASLVHRRADSLSGGQSQRVAIARALMQRPSMIFADEPAASLDPLAGEEVMETFRTLSDEAGLTVIFVSHQISHARRYADRVLGLKDKRLSIDVPAGALDEARLEGFYG